MYHASYISCELVKKSLLIKINVQKSITTAQMRFSLRSQIYLIELFLVVENQLSLNKYRNDTLHILLTKIFSDKGMNYMIIVH